MVPPNRRRSSLDPRSVFRRREYIRDLLTPSIRVRAVPELNNILPQYPQLIEHPAIVRNADLPLIFPNRPTHRAGSPTQDIIEFPLDFSSRSHEPFPQITNDIPPQELLVVIPPGSEPGQIESTSPNLVTLFDSPIEGSHEIIILDIDLSAFNEQNPLDTISAAETLLSLNETLTDLEEILGPPSLPNTVHEFLNSEISPHSLDTFVLNALLEATDQDLSYFDSEQGNYILPDSPEE